MCGIVGYIGSKNATPFLIEGLRALEYRGYDSAGIYVAGKGAIKRAGKVSNLAESIPAGFAGPSGIAHTRWATHGAPTEKNAHPHSDDTGTVWLVHNGIIENYAEIRTRLQDTGIIFQSETDTEVLAQLIGWYYAENIPLEEAVSEALKEVRGAYGIAVASTREPEKLIAARLGSPLMIGIGDEGYYIASDATPVLSHTRQVIYLSDGEMAVLTPEAYSIMTLMRDPLDKEVETLEWDLEAAQKKGYEHFMLKEIMEAPEVLENTLRGRLDIENNAIHLGGLREVEDALRNAKRIIITGCGSAYYAGLVGELLIEELAGIPVEVEIASELRYRRFTTTPEDTILIAVSQSGETADTLEAIREAKKHGMLTLGIVNAVGSTIARETDAGVYNHAGPEIGVASTKAFLSQMTVFALVALLLRELHTERSDAHSSAEIIRQLTRMPEYARRILENTDSIAAIAARHVDMRDALYIGRKFQYPIAYEGALKLKEISYVHAEAYGAGEMKHGPIALIDSSFPTVALMPRDSLYEKTRSNIEEIRARGGKIITITTGDTADAELLTEDVIIVPDTHEALMPILTTIPLQLFAYYVALARNLPIDMPRNLAKSVTVE
ncbi:glutamine--fructose-6-phosphate transaminase (isomerizing) [Patescibacteria group bacterium]|nr:glutamine--fructose-6-phosphate transaminase (isomerizing) [Patescibacteria group bacterium]